MPQQPTKSTGDVGRGDQPFGGRVVVGVDGSSGSQAALRWAVVEAGLRNGSVHAVMCWPTDFGRRTDRSDGSSSADGLAVLDRFLAEAIGAAGTVAVTVTASVSQGDPAQMLIEAARDADLLVVGSRGHGALVGTLIGSVSHHLVTHAPCIVVVVPDAEQLRRRDADAAAGRRGSYDGSAQSSQAEEWTAMRSER